MMGSPLNYFDANTGGRQGMFQMGAQIGALNSPASGPTSAIKQVLERARAWTDKQQDFEMKQQLLKTQSTSQYDQALALAKAKHAMNVPTDASGNPIDIAAQNFNFDPSRPENQRKVGNLIMVKKPITNQGQITGYDWRDPRATSMFDMINAGTGNPAEDPNAVGNELNAFLQS